MQSTTQSAQTVKAAAQGDLGHHTVKDAGALDSAMGPCGWQTTATSRQGQEAPRNQALVTMYSTTLRPLYRNSCVLWASQRQQRKSPLNFREQSREAKVATKTSALSPYAGLESCFQKLRCEAAYVASNNEFPHASCLGISICA